MVEKSDNKSFDSLKPRIESIIDQVVLDLCKDKQYAPTEGQKWSNEVAEEIVKRTQGIVEKNFKVQCLAMILNKETSGFHMSASCFWDAKADGNINKKIDFSTFYVIITLFGIARN